MWEIVGHERAVGELTHMIEAGRLPHALLISGAAGVGKTRLAMELAKALNCTESDPPCQRCQSCRAVEAGMHPDVTVIEPAEGKDSIAIGQVRELREAASLRAFQGRKKVYIIAGAEMLTAQAADALLKTLEEPQPQVEIVLTAMDVDGVPETVISRCRVLFLQPVDLETIAGALRERGVGEQAGELARLAQGRAGWALEAAGQPKLVTRQTELVERLTRVLDLDLDARLQLAEELGGSRKDRSAVRRVLELLLTIGRDLLLVAEGLGPELVAGSQQETLRDQARRYTRGQIQEYLAGIQLAMKRIDQNVDPRLTLEALLVALP